jgi:hypothetical protein
VCVCVSTFVCVCVCVCGWVSEWVCLIVCDVETSTLRWSGQESICCAKNNAEEKKEIVSH